jgi:hypothetical protein
MSQSLHALIVEDSREDAELILGQLGRDGFDVTWKRVDTEAEYRAALDPRLDIILADFSLPTFGAPTALDVLKARDLDVPLIVVSGSIGEDTAVRMLQAGASDYLLKDRLARLGQAVRRATDDRRLRREKADAQVALQVAEQRTRFALGAAQVGIWEVNLRSGVMHWSEILETHHGLAPGQFAGTFEAFLDLVHPDDRGSVQAALDAASSRGRDSNVVYRAVRPDRSVHWIHGFGRMFYDSAGAPVRAAGIGLDVTERRTLEEQYRQSQKMEAIGQLAGGVAHDFNNLLTVILGHCGLLAQAVPADHQADLSEIRHAAHSAAALTQQLLAFSRRQIVEPRVLDIRDVLGDMELMLRRLLGEHIELVFRVDDHVGHVKVDPSQVQQIILNLALNGRDAMPDGGTLLLEVADVELDAPYAREHPGTVPGSYVMLAVSDTGIGMDDETRARVFEPFFTTKPQGSGTGLGLSTVYGIVKQSQGSVWVYSEPGRGSSFKVYFPTVQAPASRPADQPDFELLSGSETILIVEDEPSLRELLRRVLAQHGYVAVAAATAEEALTIARRHTGPLHLLITDVVLPQMNGRVLADELAAIRPETRVLFMSGYTDDAVVRSGSVERGAPFLQKPFTPEGVARKVREVLAAVDGRPSADRRR